MPARHRAVQDPPKAPRPPLPPLPRPLLPLPLPPAVLLTPPPLVRFAVRRVQEREEVQVHLPLKAVAAPRLEVRPREPPQERQRGFAEPGVQVVPHVPLVAPVVPRPLLVG